MRLISLVQATHKSSRSSLIQALHCAEEIHDAGEDDEQDTTAGAESQHLWQEALVQRTESLLLHDYAQARPGPAVLAHAARHDRAVLDTALDNVHGRVENGTNGTADGTAEQIVGDLRRLVLCRGHERANLENAAKVAGVPQNVAPRRALEAVV